MPDKFSALKNALMKKPVPPPKQKKLDPADVTKDSRFREWAAQNTRDAQTPSFLTIAFGKAPKMGTMGSLYEERENLRAADEEESDNMSRRGPRRKK